MYATNTKILGIINKLIIFGQTKNFGKKNFQKHGQNLSLGTESQPIIWDGLFVKNIEPLMNKFSINLNINFLKMNYQI